MVVIFIIAIVNLQFLREKKNNVLSLQLAFVKGS